MHGNAKRDPSSDPLARGFTVEQVRLGDLFVDRGNPPIQRGFRNPFVNQIAAHFDWAHFATMPPSLSFRPDGAPSPVRFPGTMKAMLPETGIYHVMDGQSSCTAALRAGNPPGTMIWAHVYRGLSRAQEAEIFNKLNGDRRQPQPFDLFTKGVTAGDPECVALNSILEHFGWRACTSKGRGNFAAVQALSGIYRRGGGGLVHRVIRTLTDAWHHAELSASGSVLNMLADFWEHYPNTDPKRLAEKLSKRSPQELIATRRNNAKMMHIVLANEYNKCLRDPDKRLEIKS